VSADADRSECDHGFPGQTCMSCQFLDERTAHERTKAELELAKASYDGAHAASMDWAKEAGRIAEQRDAVKAELAERDARVTELTAALDRDQTGLANALGAIKQRVGAGWWITEGRGSYAWDDDRYRRETAIVLGDVAELASKALHASGDIANGALADTPLSTWDGARELRKRLDAATAREQAALAERDSHLQRYLRTRQHLDAAQADAAAMREALEAIIEENGKSIVHSGHVTETHWEPCPQDDTCDCEIAALVNAALDGTAGRVIASRLPLWRELERMMRGPFSPTKVGEMLDKLSALDEKGKSDQ
jgi:hypothetical protein